MKQVVGNDRFEPNDWPNTFYQVVISLATGKITG